MIIRSSARERLAAGLFGLSLVLLSFIGALAMLNWFVASVVRWQF